MLPTSSLPSLRLGSTLHYYTLTVLIILFFFFPATQSVAHNLDSAWNVTIPVDSSDIIYTPSRCEGDDTQSSPAGVCGNGGGWVVQRVSGDTSISTTARAAAGGILSGMFFQFHGSALYLETLQTSNAQANITVTTNSTIISAVFDSGLGSASILNLVESSVTNFSLTLLPGPDTVTSSPGFTLSSIIITVSDNISSPIIIPPPTSTQPPTPSLSTSPTTPSTQSTRGTNVPLVAGTTVSLGLSGTAGAVAAFWYWKRKRRRTPEGREPLRRNPEPESAWFGSWH